MNWTEEYLIPPIESDSLSFELLKKIVSDIRELVPHALKPHKSQVSPKKPLPKVPSEDAETAKACERIYDASLTRIDTLEKKALGLLSYVTALFALLFFAYSQFGGFQGTYWLLLPLSLLVVTLVISFRCLSVKAIQHIFVDDIYNFDDSGTATGNPDILKCYLSAAVYNDARANNTADMLRAARMTLGSSILLLIIILAIGIVSGNGVERPSNTKLQQDQVETLRVLTRSVQSMENGIAPLNAVAFRVDSLEIRMNALVNRIQSLERVSEMKVEPSSNQVHTQPQNAGALKKNR